MAVEADYYFAAGDLVNWARGLERCGEILQHRAGRVYVLPGNHESPAQIAALCERYGLSNFHEQQMRVGRYHVAGLGCSNPTPFNTPGEYSEKEIEQRLSRFADLKPLVLICHAPPYGTALDRVRNGVHAGSTAVRDFVNKQQPDYLLCGHIHEAAGLTVSLGSTKATNVGKDGHLLELQ